MAEPARLESTAEWVVPTPAVATEAVMTHSSQRRDCHRQRLLDPFAVELASTAVVEVAATWAMPDS